MGPTVLTLCITMIHLYYKGFYEDILMVEARTGVASDDSVDTQVSKYC